MTGLSDEELKKGKLVLVAARVEEDVEEGDEMCMLRTYLEDMWDDSIFLADREEMYPFEIRTYDEGVEDAWELAMKVTSKPSNGGLTSSELYHIFGERNVDRILRKFPPKEMCRKFEIWKNKPRIRTGQTVWGDYGDGSRSNIGIVLTVFPNNTCSILYNDGSIITKKIERVVSTGYNIGIEELLSKIKSDDYETLFKRL